MSTITTSQALKNVQSGLSITALSSTQQVMLFAQDGTPSAKYPIKQLVGEVIADYDASGDNIVVGTLPASGVAGKVYRVPGTNTYSDYAWNGTQFVLLATYGVSTSEFTAELDSDPMSLLDDSSSSD